MKSLTNKNDVFTRKVRDKNSLIANFNVRVKN